jgi:chromosome segregation ATPase
VARASSLATVGQALAENVFAASAYAEAVSLALREVELAEQELRLRQRELDLCERSRSGVEEVLETLVRLAGEVPEEAGGLVAAPVPVRPPAHGRPAVLLAVLRDVERVAVEHRRERERAQEELEALRAEIERITLERARTHETREQLMRALAGVDPGLHAVRTSVSRDPAEA